MEVRHAVMHDWSMRLRLRDIRERLGLTQERLAERVPFERPWISKLETGVGTWTSETLEVLSVALDVPEHELLGYSHPPDSDMTPSLRQLVHNALLLDERGIAFLADQVEVARKLGFVRPSEESKGDE